MLDLRTASTTATAFTLAFATPDAFRPHCPCSMLAVVGLINLILPTISLLLRFLVLGGVGGVQLYLGAIVT